MCKADGSQMQALASAAAATSQGYRTDCIHAAAIRYEHLGNSVVVVQQVSRLLVTGVTCEFTSMHN